MYFVEKQEMKNSLLPMTVHLCFHIALRTRAAEEWTSSVLSILGLCTFRSGEILN